MKGVSESLAGRIRILEMSGLSVRELMGNVGRRTMFRSGRSGAKAPNKNIWEIIHRGSMPELPGQHY